jgi:hypothetical protein
MKEWQDTSMASRKPSREQSTTRPCRSARGANAIECSREIESVPVSLDLLEHRLELAVNLDVKGHEDRRLERARQRFDVRLRLVVQIGDGELGAKRAESARAAPGDRVLIRDANHQALLALQAPKVGVERHGSDDLGRCHQAAPAVGARRSAASVCRAIISSSSVGMA